MLVVRRKVRDDRLSAPSAALLLQIATAKDVAKHGCAGDLSPSTQNGQTGLIIVQPDFEVREIRDRQEPLPMAFLQAVVEHNRR